MASTVIEVALKDLEEAESDRIEQLVETLADPAVRMALDLWHFGDDPELPRLLPRLAAATAVVQVADRIGPSTADMERLPAGHGVLPLETLSLALMDHGYAADFEFDPVGDAVASLGYEQVLAETRRVTDAWAVAVAERLLWNRAAAAIWQAAGHRSAAAGSAAAPAEWLPVRGGVQLRSAGSRRFQASSQTVSRGCN